MNVLIVVLCDMTATLFIVGIVGVFFTLKRRVLVKPRVFMRFYSLLLSPYRPNSQVQTGHPVWLAVRDESLARVRA